MDNIRNEFLKYINFIDSLPYEYDERIKNTLYVIVPAFIKYYGNEFENMILNTFRNVIIVIDDKGNKTVPAYYVCIPENRNEKIVLNKMVVIQNIKDSLSSGIFDSLVHEFNHAINSELMPMSTDENNLFLRTGLCKIIYDKNKMTPIGKDDSYILEEVINTYQTEKIMNIIKDFKRENIGINVLDSALYLLSDSNYQTDAYYLEKSITNRLIENRTFLSSLTKLRLKGFVEDIPSWFDSITGKEGSYKLLTQNLKGLSKYYTDPGKNIFKKYIWKKNVLALYKKINETVELFDNNTNYK